MAKDPLAGAKQQLRRCLPGLASELVDALAPRLGTDLRLARAESGEVHVTLLNGAGVEALRAVPTELRIPLTVTGAFGYLYGSPGCPRCDAGLRGGKCTISETEVVRDLWCSGCRWSQDELSGPPLSLAYSRLNAAEPKPKPAPPAPTLSNKGRLQRVRLELEDTLAFSGRSGPTQQSVWWFKVPSSWVEDGELVELAYARLYEHLYGRDWRLGNDDGSNYKVVSASARPPTRSESRRRAWKEATCYAWDRDAEAFTKVAPDEF